MTGLRLVWAASVAATAALAAPLLGCGTEPEPASADPTLEWPVHQDSRRGYSVRFPDGWHRAARRVAPRLLDPRDILALATFPLTGHRPTNCEAFAGSARSRMGRDDVLLTILERGYAQRSGRPGFPPRPETLGPADPQPGEPGEHGCGDPPGTTVHWRDFSDAGRHFHMLVAIGPEAPASAGRQAWRILDSLRFDRDHRPTWPAGPQ